jgi:hypothetical protein
METQDEQIQQAARELIARRGTNAVAFASDRVDSVARLGSRPDLDLAYRVLSAVERLVAEQAVEAPLTSAIAVTPDQREAAGRLARQHRPFSV